MRQHLKALPILLMLAASVGAFGMANSHVVRHPAFADILEQSRAKYASLKTYSDTGTVTTEYGGTSTAPATVEHFTFTTYYRTPRQFFFDFKAKDGDERLVIWSDETDFNTWWSQTKVHDTYPKGRGATAFAVTAFPTKGSAMHLAPLLFSQAGLHGSITDFKLLHADPAEAINGHRCLKLVGEVGLAYGSGAVNNVVPTTIWIDAESLLVRKIFEDTPKGSVEVERATTTFEPAADPKIDDAKFKFTPPAGT